MVVDAPPAGGPRLHKHPYVEVFVVREGSATFTAGDDVIEATGGQVVVVPAGVAHKFVNSGACGGSTYTPATISLPSGSNDRGGSIQTIHPRRSRPSRKPPGGSMWSTTSSATTKSPATSSITEWAGVSFGVSRPQCLPSAVLGNK
jgi:Cupin domain